MRVDNITRVESTGRLRTRVPHHDVLLNTKTLRELH